MQHGTTSVSCVACRKQGVRCPVHGEPHLQQLLSQQVEPMEHSPDRSEKTVPHLLPGGVGGWLLLQLAFPVTSVAKFTFHLTPHFGH